LFATNSYLITAMAAISILSENSHLGQIIFFHRKQAGLSRIQLADLAGIGKTVIFDLENGKNTVRLNTIIKVLKSLNISLKVDSPLMLNFEEWNHEKS
jgi:HTH-type transcriptional regulator / antitoxin HipB